MRICSYPPEARITAAEALSDDYFTLLFPVPATTTNIASYVQQQLTVKQQQDLLRQARTRQQAYWHAKGESMASGLQ